MEKISYKKLLLFANNFRMEFLILVHCVTGQDFHTLFPEVNDYCKSVKKTNHHKAYEKKKQKDWNNFLKFLPEGKGIYFTHSDLTSYFVMEKGSKDSSLKVIKLNREPNFALVLLDKIGEFFQYLSNL